MTHPDFKTPRDYAVRIEELAAELAQVRTQTTETAASCGFPHAPVAGADLDRVKVLLDQDASLADTLSEAVLAARDAGLLGQFIEFATVAEAGRP